MKSSLCIKVETTGFEPAMFSYNYAGKLVPVSYFVTYCAIEQKKPPALLSGSAEGSYCTGNSRWCSYKFTSSEMHATAPTVSQNALIRSFKVLLLVYSRRKGSIPFFFNLLMLAW